MLCPIQFWRGRNYRDLWRTAGRDVTLNLWPFFVNNSV